MGVIIGPIFGATTGSRDRYIFSSDAPVDGYEDTSPTMEQILASLAVGELVSIVRFRNYWPHKYEGVVVSISDGYVILDTERGKSRIRRDTIQMIYRKSVEVES